MWVYTCIQYKLHDTHKKKKLFHPNITTDSHDAVVRFNHAPTMGYVNDVGSRTTLRIVNSQVVTKPEYDFWGSPLYSDVALLLWDPNKYHGSLDEVRVRHKCELSIYDSMLSMLGHSCMSENKRATKTAS